MMTRLVLTVAQQERPGFSGERACWCDGRPPFKAFARTGVLALATFLVVGLAPPALAGTLDQAVSGALDRNCAPMRATLGLGLGNSTPGLISLGFGPNLAQICADLPSGTSGPGFTSGGQLAGGSVTEQTRQAVTFEEIQVLRRLEEERRKMAQGSEFGAHIASLGAEPYPWQLGEVMVTSADPTVGAPALAQIAKGPIRVTGIEIQEATPKSAIIRIQADQPVANYKAFLLDNPPRLVIDITGALLTERMPPKQAGKGAIKQIRSSQYRGKPDPVVRLVLDLASTLPYQVVGVPETVRILIGEAVAKAPPQPPTLTAEKPKFAPGEAEEPFWRKVGVWGAGLYERFDKDVTTFEPGYDSNKWGFNGGADYPFSDQFIAGLAFNYSRESGAFDNAGGDFTTTSYGGLLYASFFPAPNFFIDGYFQYARNDYSVDRGVSYNFDRSGGTTLITSVSGIAASDTDGNEFKFGVKAGYDFFLKNFTIGPRVGLNYQHIDIDGFSEKGTTASNLSITARA